YPISLRRLDERGPVVDPCREVLLDEGDVPPRIGAEIDRVVVGLAREALHRHRDLVPLLARHLAGLAADAHRGVGEQPHARLGLIAVGGGPGVSLELHQSLTPALWRYWFTNSSRAFPRGRRPGRMSHVATLYSLMWTLLSST